MPFHKAYQNKFNLKIPKAINLVEKILCIPNHENLKKNQNKNLLYNQLKIFFHEKL